MHFQSQCAVQLQSEQTTFLTTTHYYLLSSNFLFHLFRKSATCQSAEGMSDARLLLWLPFSCLLYIGLVDANDDHDKVDLQPEYYHLPVVQ